MSLRPCSSSYPDTNNGSKILFLIPWSQMTNYTDVSLTEMKSLVVEPVLMQSPSLKFSTILYSFIISINHLRGSYNAQRPFKSFFWHFLYTVPIAVQRLWLSSYRRSASKVRGLQRSWGAKASRRLQGSRGFKQKETSKEEDSLEVTS
jgi:hypothetical protein